MRYEASRNHQARRILADGAPVAACHGLSSVAIYLADYTLLALIYFSPLLPWSVAAFSLPGLLPSLFCRQRWQLGDRQTARIVGAILGAAMLETPTQDSHVRGWYAPLARDAARVMPLWILVCMALVSLLLWIAFLMVQRREQQTAERDCGSHAGLRDRFRNAAAFRIEQLSRSLGPNRFPTTLSCLFAETSSPSPIPEPIPHGKQHDKAYAEEHQSGERIHGVAHVVLDCQEQAGDHQSGRPCPYCSRNQGAPLSIDRIRHHFPPVLRASCETNFALSPSVPPCGGGARRARPTLGQSSGRFALSAAGRSCRSPIVAAMPTRGNPSLEPMSTVQHLATRRVTPQPFRVGAATSPSRTATSNVLPLLGPPSCKAPHRTLSAPAFPSPIKTRRTGANSAR